MKKIYLVSVFAFSGLMLQATTPKNGTTPARKSVSQLITGSASQRTTVVCDTLQNFSSTDSLTVYLDPSGGYISGHNSYGDIAKAEMYTGVTAGSTVGTFIIYFGAASAANATDTFNVQLWDVASGVPGAVLASTSYTYQDASNAVTANSLVIVDFAAPAAVNTAFLAGISFDYTLGDTVALVSTVDGTAIPATAWELFSDGTSWYPFDNGNSWGLGVSHVVLPVVCGSTGVKNVDYDKNVALYPSITSDNVNLLIAPSFEKVAITITDLTGKVVMQKNISTRAEHIHQLDLSSLGNGTYFVNVGFGADQSIRKVIVQR